ncbi:MAG: hypothetical protein KAS67_05805 [Thermoplasmata archaeon]|nr:hypothetical protein [Thermoplasmata archaeon]
MEKIEEFKALLRSKEGLWECMEGLDNEDPSSIDCFGIFLKSNPEDIDAHIGKALAIYNTGRWEDAIKQLTEGLRLDPAYEPGLLIRAEILRERGKLQFALKFYEKLLVISPSDENYLEQKAELLEEMSKEEDEPDEEGPRPEPQDESADDSERVMMFRGMKVTKAPAPEFIPGEVEELPEVPDDEPPEESPSKEKCPKCDFMKEDGLPCQFCDLDGSVKDTIDMIPDGELDNLIDELDDLDLDEIDRLSATEEEIDDEESIERDMEELGELVCEGCGDILDPDDEICRNCGEEPDKVMVMRGIMVSKVSEADSPALNNYEEDRWSSFVDKARTDRNRTVSIVGIFCIISIAIYLIFISLLAIYDSFFVEFDTIVLIPNLIIFIMGFGALYGGVSVAKNSIVFDHFLDSIFETEIYPRLEPALEEVAQVQARLDNIEDKIERMNMNISRSGKYPSAAEFPAVAISNRITSFLKIVVVINITIGILMYTISNPGRYAPYLFTIMFMLWWGVITDDYDLWKNAISWAWAILPIFAVPFMSIFLYVVMPIGTLIGLIGGFLIIYAYSYFAWVRYYVEGKLPFNVHEAQLEDEEE